MNLTFLTYCIQHQKHTYISIHVYIIEEEGLRGKIRRLMQMIKLIADLAGTEVHDDRVCYESIVHIIKTHPQFKRISLKKLKQYK